MSGGRFHSSKTRVVPVFDALSAHEDNWIPALLEMAEHFAPEPVSGSPLDLTYKQGYWGSEELGMAPPISLLTWMIQHPKELRRKPPTGIAQRDALLNGDPTTRDEALRLLNSKPTGKVWYVFEGLTYPDAVIETPDALIVIEGKRTEPKPTTDTTWLRGRHQIWRHVDAAWNWKYRNDRKVLGMYIVEGDEKGTLPTVPGVWSEGLKKDLTPEALQSSFPHRSPDEQKEISTCLLGVTTWQRVVDTFGLPKETLIESL